MQQETSTIPHIWLLLSNAVTAVLAVITTLTTLRFKQKREPAEVRKIDAEARSIHISTEVAQHGIAIETWREIQAVIEKAEVRREAWLLKEEQLRTQIMFWRNKSEELDGELIDSRDANVQLNARLKIKQDALDKAASLIHYHSLSFSEADMPEIKRLVDTLKARETDPP